MTHRELVEKVAIAVLASECAPVTWEELPNRLKNERRVAAREAIRIVGEACDIAITEKALHDAFRSTTPTSPHDCAVVVRDLCQSWRDGKSNKKTNELEQAE